MKYKIGFTKKEIIVVIICGVFLLLNLGAIGSNGRRNAKDLVCLSNLRRWGVIFDMYTRDNNGHFFSGSGNGTGRWWIELLQPYYSPKLLLCPETANTKDVSFPQTAFQSWQVSTSEGYIVGSYGLNGWICNPLQGTTSVWGRSGVSDYWRYPNVEGANNIPVFLDMWWVDAWPRITDAPPIIDGTPGDTPNSNEMRRVCINRHNAAVNGLFMDWSARKIGLKELWILKWHRSFNIVGPWTRAGGVMPNDWPMWMRNFKDY